EVVVDRLIARSVRVVPAVIPHLAAISDAIVLHLGQVGVGDRLPGGGDAVRRGYPRKRETALPQQRQDLGDKIGGRVIETKRDHAPPSRANRSTLTGREPLPEQIAPNRP